MASYVAVHGTQQGIGNEDLYAIVIDDGDETIVLGETDVAEDLRDQVELADGVDEHARLASILTGLSYYRLLGPISITGSSQDAVTPLQALYFGEG